MQTEQLERVTCGWCHTEFDIDPALAANLYTCPGCPERQLYGNLRHANLNPNALEQSHASSTAAANNLGRHTLAFTFVKEREEQVGSGTLIEIGGHVLIATAAHTIPIRADRISDLRTGRAGVRSRLIGFPKAKVRRDHAGNVLGFGAILYSCEPIDPMAWHGVPVVKNECHYPDNDVLLHYSTDEPLFVHSENPNRDEFAPEPFGLSGGGLWQFPESRKDRVWSPSMLSLFGIQSSWCKGQKHLKAIQIIHWLRLVVKTYPELREELHNTFPRLNDFPNNPLT